jgi:hypothetical protein
MGEVFGCLVMNLGWSGGGCGQWWAGGFGNWGQAETPVTTSTDSRYSGLAPYVHAFEHAWYGALRRMQAEALALGAHGVVGVRIERTRLEGQAWEFTALGTAVRSVDPTLVPYPTEPNDLWTTNLSVEDCAAAILSGYLPRETLLGMSVSTKHEDWTLKTQRSSWSNTEVHGMSLLIQAARDESRSLLKTHATHRGSAELVVTDMHVSEFETQCGQNEVDLHAQSIVVGTTLVPLPHLPRARQEATRAMTILPLRPERTAR